MINTLASKLSLAYPNITFSEGSQFCWSPETNEVFFRAKAKGRSANWSLLHEASHALLGHKTYNGDIQLLNMEVAAWDKAKELAAKFNISIDPDHIQDCLDTYRGWIYRRSICPSCGAKSIQQSDLVGYRCFNCHEVWSVSPNRFIRPYRSILKNNGSDAILFNEKI
jgi:hypothetical protein